MPLQGAVVSTLQNYEIFAIATDNSVVRLGTTAAFSDWGAEQVAIRRVRQMTHVDRVWKRLIKNSPVLVRTYIADVDK
jgi:hypothetical protein